ncbi:MAG: hypothetical protein ACI4RT_01440 [Candidatus Spyradenecus sp.]
MTAEETRALIDCLTHEDCTIRLWGAVYWCLGLTHDERTGLWAMGVYECEGDTPVFKRQLFSYSAPCKEACMRHFLEDRYWEGRSFYEVAAEMSWVDL